MSDIRYGAFPKDWLLLSDFLNLTADLLPTVSRPDAVISPNSNMKSLGKTPSLYGGSGVVGIPKWTQKVSTEAEVEVWSGNPDYGICIQARTIRAFDIDVADPVLVRRILAVIAGFGIVFPKRTRENSSKCLLPFRLEGIFRKRRMDLGNGNVIEFLGNGQQWVAAGTHPSGSRYELDMNGRADFPVVSVEIFEMLWSALEAVFAVGRSSEEKAEERKSGERIDCEDPRADFLRSRPCYRGENVAEGVIYIECPFKDEHTGDSGDTETVYFVAGTNGYPSGHYKCLHAHCAGRGDGAFDNALGYYAEDFTVDDFDAIVDEVVAGVMNDDGSQEKGVDRFKPIQAAEFMNQKLPEWIVKNTVAEGEVAVIFGESGSGKSFLALDIGLAIARGIEWNENKTKQGRVVYIAAEGEGGVRKRLRAYAQYNGVEINMPEFPFDVIPACPNFLTGDDSVKVGRAILDSGDRPRVIIVDTLAQVAPGGDENTSKDMGGVLARCKGLHRATGALVVLIAHTGKDASRGIRGWSGIRGALDTNIEVVRENDNRSFRVDKQKDGEDGECWGFRLVPVVIGIDEDGDDITSCVFELTGLQGIKKIRKTEGKKERPVGDWQIIVFDALERIINEGREANERVVIAVAETIALEKFPRKERTRFCMNRALYMLKRKGVVFEDENGILSI